MTSLNKETVPQPNPLTEQLADVVGRINEVQMGLIHTQQQVLQHRHDGNLASRVNSSDVFHTRPALALPLAAGTFSFDPRGSDVFTVTPTAGITLTPQTIPNGQRITLVIKTSGTTSFTITFGSGFTAVGTLSTGTVSGVFFTITFAGDGVNLREVGRTAAMTPS